MIPFADIDPRSMRNPPKADFSELIKLDALAAKKVSQIVYDNIMYRDF